MHASLKLPHDSAQINPRGSRKSEKLQLNRNADASSAPQLVKHLLISEAEATRHLGISAVGLRHLASMGFVPIMRLGLVKFVERSRVEALADLKCSPSTP
jgi:hypothetical protein